MLGEQDKKKKTKARKQRIETIPFIILKSLLKQEEKNTILKYNINIMFS